MIFSLTPKTLKLTKSSHFCAYPKVLYVPKHKQLCFAPTPNRVVYVAKHMCIVLFENLKRLLLCTYYCQKHSIKSFLNKNFRTWDNTEENIL